MKKIMDKHDVPILLLLTLVLLVAAQVQRTDAGMTVGTRYEYTKIGSAEQKWWGCVLVGFDGGHPLIRTDAGHYHLRPLTEYRFRTAKEES